MAFARFLTLLDKNSPVSQNNLYPGLKAGESVSVGITNRQIFFILILTITSYTTIDLPQILMQVAGRSGWMLIIALGLVFSLAAVMVTWLNSRFPGKVLFEFSRDIAGTVISRVIIIYYILYFALVGVYLKVRLVEFLTSNFLPKTPQNVMLAVAVALFAYVSYHGITNVGRLFELYGVLYLLVTIVICAVMLPQGMIYNIMPFINPNEFREFPAAIPHLLFPFGGIEVLFIIPFTKVNRRAMRLSFLTLVFISLFFVLIVESTVSLLGVNNTILYNDSFIEAIKIVNLPIIERTDLFYLTVGLTSLFAGMIMVFLVVLEFTSKLFPKVSRLKMTLIIGVILYALSIFAIRIHDIAAVMDNLSPYLVLVSSLLIPVVLVLIVKVKKLGGRKEEGGA